MQADSDIFSIWPSIGHFAEDINQKRDTVRKWAKARRIPQPHWNSVIAAAAARGRAITTDDLHKFNAPMKQRGRPAHKAVRLAESGAT